MNLSKPPNAMQTTMVRLEHKHYLCSSTLTSAGLISFRGCVTKFKVQDPNRLLRMTVMGKDD